MNIWLHGLCGVSSYMTGLRKDTEKLDKHLWMAHFALVVRLAAGFSVVEALVLGVVVLLYPVK